MGAAAVPGNGIMQRFTPIFWQAASRRALLSLAGFRCAFFTWRWTSSSCNLIRMVQDILRFCKSQGLADSLKAAATVFYFAVLTDRAFLLYIPMNHYEWAYGQPNINWTLPWPMLSDSVRLSCVKHHWLGNVSVTRERFPADLTCLLALRHSSWKGPRMTKRLTTTSL